MAGTKFLIYRNPKKPTRMATVIMLSGNYDDMKDLIELLTKNEGINEV